jgi:predicted nucleic acid-binding protein
LVPLPVAGDSPPRDAADVMERYADLKLGLTDASIVVLAPAARPSGF